MSLAVYVSGKRIGRGLGIRRKHHEYWSLVESLVRDTCDLAARVDTTADQAWAGAGRGAATVFVRQAEREVGGSHVILQNR